MIFLNGILLAGAAAFLVPLLIYIFNRRKVSVVRWGAMHLLQEVIRQRRRRIQIEQWLLLAVRIALPIILAVCLARPVLSAMRSLPGWGRSSLVVLLDDSFSMRAAGAGESLLQQASLAIQRITEELPRGSDVQVVLAGGSPRKLLDQPTTAMDLLPKALADVPGMSGPMTPNEAFQSAGSVLAKAGSAGREVVVMSDFQQADWKPFAEGASLPALESMMRQEPKPAVTFFRLGGGVTENLGIASLDLSALVAAEGQPIGVRVRVRNYGKRLWQDIALNLEADGARLRTTRITVPPEGEVTLSLTHSFDKVGDHSLGVRLEGDSFTEDNAAQAVVHIRHQINALLVDGHPGNEPLSGAADFVELALSPNMAVAAAAKDLVITSKVEDKRLRKEDLAGKEVVILADVDRIPGGRLSELEKYVKDGGGLLIFAGPSCDLAAYNRDFFRGGQGLYPAVIKGFGSVSNGENPARVLLQRFTHPVTAYFNDPHAGRLQDAEFRTWFQFDLKDDQARPLLNLDRGAPLLVEKSFGQGRVIAAAMSANSEWTNLPLQMVFVPLMQRLVSHLATGGGGASALTVGQTVRFGLRDGRGDEVYEMTDPAGKVAEINARKEAGGVVVESPPAREPGIYEVRARTGGEPSKYAFNVNPAESDLRCLPAADVQKLAQRHDAAFVENVDAYERISRERRHGTELWQPFLFLLLFLLFFEVFLQQRIAKP